MGKGLDFSTSAWYNEFMDLEIKMKPLTREEIIARVKRSLAQAERGEVTPARVVQEEMRARYGL